MAENKVEVWAGQSQCALELRVKVANTKRTSGTVE